MANYAFNIALGRAVQFYDNVDNNSPANSALILVIIETSTGDATLRDLDTLALVTGDAGTAEVTNTNYNRKVLTDSELAAWSPDDANDRVDLDFPDQSWTGVVAGDNWTDAILCYDADTGAGDDTNLIPISQHDFVVSPDGSDINLTTPNGFYRAQAA